MGSQGQQSRVSSDEREENNWTGFERTLSHWAKQSLSTTDCFPNGCQHNITETGQRYMAQRRAVIREVKQAKNKWFQQKANQVESAMLQGSSGKEVWQGLREIQQGRAAFNQEDQEQSGRWIALLVARTESCLRWRRAVWLAWWITSSWSYSELCGEKDKHPLNGGMPCWSWYQRKETSHSVIIGVGSACWMWWGSCSPKSNREDYKCWLKKSYLTPNGLHFTLKSWAGFLMFMRATYVWLLPQPPCTACEQPVIDGP